MNNTTFKTMKKIRHIWLVLTLLSTYSGVAQEFQGKATYQTKTNIDFSNFGNRGSGGGNISEEQRQMMMERMKQAFEKTFSLTFNRMESIYKEEEKQEQPGMGGGMMLSIMGSFVSGTYYKNIGETRYLDQRELYGKMFLVSDTLQKLDWKMTGETKTIGQYTCYKATAMKKVNTSDFASFRQRRDVPENDSIPSNAPSKEEPIRPEEIEVTAWYTLDIPINQGPAEYWGLPGLILEVSSGRTTILCSKITLNPEEKEKIKPPSGGKKVSQEEYNEIFVEKMQEMRENFRGRRGGRSGFMRFGG